MITVYFDFVTARRINFELRYNYYDKMNCQEVDNAKTGLHFKEANMLQNHGNIVNIVVHDNNMQVTSLSQRYMIIPITAVFPKIIFVDSHANDKVKVDRSIMQVRRYGLLINERDDVPRSSLSYGITPYNCRTMTVMDFCNNTPPLQESFNSDKHNYNVELTIKNIFAAKKATTRQFALDAEQCIDSMLWRLYQGIILCV